MVFATKAENRAIQEMSWWKRFQNWRNPTRAWRIDQARPLILDLDRHQLCSISVGDPIDALSFLGPAARWTNALEFPNHGIAIRSNSVESVSEFMVFFGHTQEPRSGAFRGAIVHRGAQTNLSNLDTETSVTERFGLPYWRDMDDDETILFFEWSWIEWQVEFGADTCLKCLVISEPLLANAAQRAAYGITKAWPPR